MSTSVTFNGLTYTIPATGDESWGDYTSLFLISVANNALAKSGGVFELTGDVDFGPGFGLKAAYYKSRSSNISTVGVVRLANNESLAWRNAGNTADYELKVTSGNHFQFNGHDLADIDTVQTFTNKSIDAGTNTLTNITNSSIATSAAIAYSKLNLTGGIVNADINSAAAIAGTKVSPSFGSQNISTTGTLGAGATSLTGALNMNTNLINNVVDPVSAQDAATKSYVDSVAQGLNVKNSAVAATLTNVTGTYIGTPTFTLTTAASSLVADGITLANGDRVLLKAQTDAKQNGIYTVSGVGSTVVLTRATDANSSAELKSAFIFIEQGSTLDNTGWVMTTNTFVLDSSNCVWTQFAGAGTYTASTGLTLVAQDFQVGTSGANGISNSMVNTAAAIARSKLASGTASHVLINDVSGVMSSEASLAITRGGTGQATATLGFDALSPTTTRGDLIARGASNNVRLAIGSANTVLLSNATDPSWGQITDAYISSSAAITRSKIAAGTVAHVLINDPSTGLMSSEARLALSRFAVGTSGLPLVGNGASDSSYAQISLTAAVTGTLPVANGGTGTIFGGVLAAEDVILGSSSTALKRLAVGSNGQVLTITGGAVAWSTGTLSGTNTGDVTLGTFGSSPNSSGVSLASQVLTLQPASASQPGGVSTTTQQFLGAKTFMTSMKVRDTAAAFDLSFVSTSATALTADHNLTFNVQNADRTISMAGNLTVAGTASVNGTNTGDQTITLTGNVTGSGTGSFATTIAAGVILDSMVSAGAGIQYSKLTLTNSVVNADIAAAAAIAITKIAPGSANQVIGANAGATANEYKTISTGTSGTDFAVAFAANSITFNLPDAAAGARGLVTTGSQTFGGTKTLAAIIVSGELSTKKGADYTTTGTSNDVPTTGFSLFRYTGAGTATITGFANPIDGKHLTLINASSSTVSISNNDVGSAAANRIITGTGASVTMAAGSSLFFEYDITAQFWRVVGGSGAGSLSVITVTGNATIAAGTDIELVNSTSACTITMPAVASGKLVRVKDSTGNATTANITISGASGALIDGQANFVMTQNYQAANFVSDGTNWFTV